MNTSESPNGCPILEETSTKPGVLISQKGSVLHTLYHETFCRELNCLECKLQTRCDKIPHTLQIHNLSMCRDFGINSVCAITIEIIADSIGHGAWCIWVWLVSVSVHRLLNALVHGEITDILWYHPLEKSRCYGHHKSVNVVHCVSQKNILTTVLCVETEHT